MASRPLQAAAGAYEYNPLSYEVDGQIRVLVVDEGEIDIPITGSLQVTTVIPERSLSAAPLLEWDAISYSWGGQDLSEDIYVDGRPLKVTKNVSDLIRDRRDRLRKRVLWIDAVCINQTDEREKSSQVPQMQQIYQRAHAVIIWLPSDGGNDRDVTALAAARWLNEKVDKGVNPQSHPSETLVQCFSRENPLASWNSISWDSPFHEILGRSWFDRIWVVQKAVLAQNLFILVNPLSIPWDLFSTATLMFMSNLSADVALETSLEACYARCLEKGFLSVTLNGLSMVHLIHQLRVWNQNSDIPIAPSELVYLCGRHQASVQSDKIFAVTGLFGLKDRHSSYNGLDINYQMPYTEVYKYFTIWCIQQERNLDVLAQQRNEGSMAHSSLPSWATDWSNSASLNLSTTTTTTETIPFTFRQATLCADTCRDIPIYRRENDALILRGFVIDTVKGYIRYVNGTDKGPLLEWQKAIPGDKEANRILFCEESPSLESLEQLREKSLQNNAITSHLWRDGALKIPKSERSTYRTTLLTERGYLAICYPWWGYRDGPKICALYGGRSLFILFPVGGTPGKPLYRLVCGDCFINGFGDGRGIEMARKLGLREEDFWIV